MIAFAVLVAACVPSPSPSPCEGVAGATFSSTEEHECGLGPDGPVMCTWTLTFDASTWTWTHSDYGESGSWSCVDGAITGTSTSGTYDGAWDPATGELTWDGLSYEVSAS
jgi:hypothetical protein